MANKVDLFTPNEDTLHIKCANKKLAQEVKTWLCDVGEQSLMEWLEDRGLPLKITPKYHEEPNYIYIGME